MASKILLRVVRLSGNRFLYVQGIFQSNYKFADDQFALAAFTEYFLCSMVFLRIYLIQVSEQVIPRVFTIGSGDGEGFVKK